VYERALDARGEQQQMLFEVVPGARLVGTPSRRRVRRAGLRTVDASRFVAHAAADADGRYELVLPYASGARGEIESAAHYEVKSGGKVAEVPVAEEQVQRGEQVTAPALHARRGAGEHRRG
jgi:hypothetical protein